MPREKRPTYDGSSAQAVALANDDKHEVDPVSADSSDTDSDEDAPFVQELKSSPAHSLLHLLGHVNVGSVRRL